MTSRNSINIILFLIVCALIAFLFFDQGKPVASTFKISSVTEQSINSIEISRLTGESLTFKKIKEYWYMISPYKIRANSFYIESILRITRAKSASRFTISKTDKNKFKLNPPQATLKLNQQLFLFGTNEQLNLNRYILTNDKLYLSPDRFFYLLNISTTGFIDHALIAQGEKITGIKLAKHNIQLKNTKWTVTPKYGNNSVDDIVQFITQWSNSQTIEINKLTDIEQFANKFNIEISLKGQSKPIIFEVSSTDDFYFFSRPDLKLQYKLTHEMANLLLKIPLQESLD